jgi:hypothetical protein
MKVYNIDTIRWAQTRKIAFLHLIFSEVAKRRAVSFPEIKEASFAKIFLRLN